MQNPLIPRPAQYPVPAQLGPDPIDEFPGHPNHVRHLTVRDPQLNVNAIRFGMSVHLCEVPQ